MIKGGDKVVDGYSRTFDEDAETVNFLDFRAASEFVRVNTEMALGFVQMRVEGLEKMVVLGRFGIWRIRV